MAPNGVKNESYFQFYVALATFPTDIKKIKIMVNVRTILEHEGFETKYERDLHHNKPCMFYGGEFFKFELTNKLSLEATVIIKELYDMNDNIVPKNEWINHNVIQSK